MRGEERRFYLSGPGDWPGAARDNVEIQGNGAHIRVRSPGCQGLMISPPLDCLEEETVWHRLRVEAMLPDGAGLEIMVYASDQRLIELKGEPRDVYDFLYDRDISASDKLTAFEPYRKLRMITPKDLLLHDVKGRYLWLAIVMTGQQDVSPSVVSVDASFPRQSLTDYLPEVYQAQDRENDFLTRYLALFGVAIDDMEESIDGVARMLDAEICDEQLLRWLSGWLAVENVALWEKERLRELMRSAAALYRIRGTPRSIAEIVRIYTGESPYVVETAHTLIMAANASPQEAMLLSRLYGDDPRSFTVLVTEKGVPNERSAQELARIIDAFRPAHTVANLAVLRPYIFLDQHSYLGKNTWLSSTRELSLDGHGTLPYVALLGKQQEQQPEKGWQDG